MRRSFVLFSFTIHILAGSLFASPAWTAENPFTDVDASHPRFAALSYLKGKNVIDGYPDGSFQPDAKVNRAEATKMLVRGLDIKTSSGATLSFRDTRNQRLWYVPYVAAAHSAGFVNGYPNRTFRPTRTIIRVEGLKMVLHAYGVDMADADAQGVSLYSDTTNSTATAWFQPYVSYAIKKNLIAPKEGARFGVQDPLTRGELAELMYRLSFIREGSLPAFVPKAEQGLASFYGKAFYGRKTSSGITFVPGFPTAAHRSLPFGTIVEALHAMTGKGTLVQIQDRGPYVDGRVIDLSEYSFEKLEKLSMGVFPIRLNVRAEADLIGSLEFPTDTFWDQSRALGVKLDVPLSTTFIENGVHTISGTVTSSATFVTALVKNEEKKYERAYEAPVTGGRFTLPLHTPVSGTYTLNLLPDNVGVGEATITVIPQKAFEDLQMPKSAQAPGGVSSAFVNDEARVSWDANGNGLFRLRLGGKTLYVNGGASIALPPEAFGQLAGGKTMLTVEGAQTTGGNPLTITSGFAASLPVTVDVVRSEYEINDAARVTMDPIGAFHDGKAIRLTGTAKVPTEGEAWYTLPSGKTRNVSISSSSVLQKGDKFSVNIPITESGTYIVEINDTGHEAVFNMPFYHPGSLPVIENERDAQARMGGSGLGKDTAKETTDLLTTINRERTTLGSAPLTQDPTAVSIAKERVADMVQYDYVSHTSPDGTTIADFQTRYNLTGAIGENIAIDVNSFAALQGLLRSPIHRDALLSPVFDRIGIALSTIKTGQAIMTQIFLGK